MAPASQRNSAKLDQSVVSSETSPLLGAESQKVSLKPTAGDINCFFTLLMNNLGTMIVTAQLLKTFLNKPYENLAKPTNVDDIVFGNIIPGMVPTTVMGSFYFAWMTYRIVKKAPPGTSMTVLPSGINTAASLCFIFSIMVPAINEFAAEGKMTPNAAVEKAWGLGVIANFIAGVISMLCAFVGPALVKVTPPAALMIALAGIGFTWLGLNPLLQCFSFARCGVFTLLLGMLLNLNIIKTGRLPPAVVLIVVGTCLGWCSGHEWVGGGNLKTVQEAFESIHPLFPTPIGASIFGLIPEVLEKNIGVILPVAFTGAIGTMLNVTCAERTGDFYPLAETLFIDGLTTCISALFGSPFGTCVYVGHTQYKAMGGKIAYPILFGVSFSVLALGGSIGFISSLVPPYAIAPMLIFIGLMIVTDAMSTAPTRHLPACILGLCPAVADWIVKSAWSPASDRIDASWWGLQSLAQGSLLLCILWTCICVSLIDSQFAQATLWCLGGAAMSAVGLIHQSTLDLQMKSFFESTSPFPKNTIGTQPVSLTIGYMSVAILFSILWSIQQVCPQSGIVGMPYKEIEHETVEAEEVKRLSLLVEDSRKMNSFISTSAVEIHASNLEAPTLLTGARKSFSKPTNETEAAV